MRTMLRTRWLQGALLCALLVPARSASAEDAPKPAPPAPPAAPAGAIYRGQGYGVTLEGPVGWRLEEGTGVIPQWINVAVFTDPTSGGSAVLAVRKPSALRLPKLKAEVTKAYADDKTFNVTSITDQPVSGKRPMPGVLVDATQLLPAPPTPAAAPGTPPGQVSWRVLALYLLGADYEYLLYTQVRATVFPKYQAAIEKMMEGISVKLQGSAFSPKGDGAFRDDTAGFSCRFPSGYGVRLPERTLHLVEFAPAGDGPVLGIYRYDSEADLEHEAKTLVDYYTGSEIGGEATAGTMEVAGRSAALVTAKARIGGRDQVFFLAVVKRGNDTFRLRVAADVQQEAAAKATFEPFVKSFALTNG